MSEIFFTVTWYQWITAATAGISLSALMYHLIRIIRTGIPGDFAPPAGRIRPAVTYSFSGAMSPGKKETALLHPLSYSAGIIYHLGTFLAIFVLIWIWTGYPFPGPVTVLISAFLALSAAAGLYMLSKRMFVKRLRELSAPDDYISNVAVTLLQTTLVLSLWYPLVKPMCFLAASVLMLWFPLGKLKHSLYFFVARVQLGIFFGRRGIWPP